MQLISIIVPVYNAENTIRRCIDSILTQTYKNFELILINDGSKDGSLNIIKEYEVLDERVTVISQENSGVSTARNMGINKSNGDYIVFVDSDDYIKENTIETLLNEIKSNNELDVVISGFYVINNNNKYINTISEFKVFNNLDFLFDEKFFKFINTPWGKLFRSEIIKNNNIKFDKNLSLGEDTIFVLEYLKYIKNIKFINDALFFINETEGSLSRRNRMNIFENIMLIYDKEKELFQYRNECEFNKLVPFYLRNVKICLNTAVSFRWKRKEYKELCNKIRSMEDFKKINIKEIHLNQYDKIIFYLLKNKHIYILRVLLKFKNLIKRDTRKVFENIKNSQIIR